MCRAVCARKLTEIAAESEVDLRMPDPEKAKGISLSTKSNSGKRDIPLTENAKKAMIRQKELDLILGKRAGNAATHRHSHSKTYICHLTKHNKNAALLYHFKSCIITTSITYHRKEMGLCQNI